MTTEQKKLNWQNRLKAREYFGITGQSNLVLHHKDPSWRENDVERYIQWNPEDLIVMTASEHHKLHAQLSQFGHGPKSKETIEKMLATFKERQVSVGENNGFYGKHHSEETKKRLSEAHLNCDIYHSDEFRATMSKVTSGEGNPNYGKKWYNDGVKNYAIRNGEPIPEGLKKGMVQKHAK